MIAINCCIVIYNEYLKGSVDFKNLISSNLTYCRILVTDNSEKEIIGSSNKVGDELWKNRVNIREKGELISMKTKKGVF